MCRGERLEKIRRLVNDLRKQLARGPDDADLVALLDEEEFAVSTRSACETDSEEGSRAVLALFGDSERARTTLRISWGPDTRSRELTRFAQALIKAVVFIDNNSRG